MMRTYEFYDNGRTHIDTLFLMPGELRPTAQRMFGEYTAYVDVLSEGILVARVERSGKVPPPRKGYGR